MLKKQPFILLFLLGLLAVVYQNCAETNQSNLFGSNCSGESCGPNPDDLSMELDSQILSGGTFKISSNPAANNINLRLTGTCESAGYQKSLVKAKVYQCSGSHCGILKHSKYAQCSSGRFEIASTVSNLTPGSIRLQMEVVGVDKFEQEVYGRNSKLPLISGEAKQTINPPVLASFSGTNFWAQDKIYYFPSSTEKVVLDGFITGFCDYDAANTSISVKLSLKGSSQYTLLGNTYCQKINEGTTVGTSPNRNGRSGYFQLDSFSIFFVYGGGSFVTCNAGDNNCINNVLNKTTNRLVNLSIAQRDLGFNYDVFSNRRLVLHYTGERAGKGWLAEVLVEVLKRAKKSFNFSNSNVSGELTAPQAGTSDYSQAYRVLTSIEEFFDPLITTGANRYGFGSRAFIVKWLLGATEDISASEYGVNNIYFLGSANTVQYKNMAHVNLNGGLICSLEPNMADPIKSVVGPQYSTDIGVERIALCLTHRYLNGIWDKPYADTVKLVQHGVTFANNNANCFYSNGGAINNRDCATLLEFLQIASSMKSTRLPGVSFGNATDTQLKYFGNGMTQYYINKIMYNLAYRNTGMGGENEIFADIFSDVYPEITDVNLRRSLYPNDYSYPGSTVKFGGLISRPYPDGSVSY